MITSCSKEDSPSDTSGSIIGTWTGVAVDYSGKTVTTAGGQTINADYVGEAYDVNYTLTFSDNPKNLVSTGSYSIKLTTTVAGQSTINNVENLKVAGDGIWERLNNKLTINSNGKMSNLTIDKLTETELVLSGKEVTDLSQQGASVVTTTDVIVTFKRK